VSESGDKIRIMVVEDEPDIGLIVSEILRAKYEVLVAKNGLEALERIGRYEPDCAVMDLMMPVLDGFDTTRAIRKDATFANMPVLFLTARKDNQAVREALMAGGDVYLEKPFHPPELMLRVDEVIAKNNLQPKRRKHTMTDVVRFFAALESRL